MTTGLELNLMFFAVTIPAVLWAGISKGGFGSGAAFAATPMLALILDPGLAVGLMLPLLMVMDISLLRPYWGKWSWPNAKVLILGAVPGTAIGAAIYGAVDADTFRVMIGVVALGFVLFQGARKIGLLRVKQHEFRPLAGAIWGMVGGFTSFISHAGGPPVAMHLLSQKLDKLTYQATSVIVFWIINILKFIPYAWLGIFTWETALADIYLVPVAVIGTWAGVYAHRLVPERIYFAIAYAMLVLAGGKLLFDGLT
ncbi:MAG: sulfite exporter TauE/SafE family protein [Rhodobacteraceae bacterium]|nr:sulfite exporter TauE/SafE family protein [Paracoccaceae bacterium]